MQSRTGWTAISILFILSWPSGTRAGDASRVIPSEIVLERFQVPKNGDALVIPVRFGGKYHLFLVDTACTKTIFDSSLPLGIPRTIATIETARGEVEVKTYDPPDTLIGKLPFKATSTIVALDLKKIREVTGYPVEGLLGIDFLGNYIIHLDSDGGELYFLKSVPRDGSTSLPMSWEPGEAPEVTGFVTGSEQIHFKIDTGNVTPDSGSLTSQIMQQLVGAGKLRKIGSALHESASGTFASPISRGSLLAVGAFVVQQPIFDESPRHNVLGLGFWTRFSTTFDFPRKTVYLRKAVNYERPEMYDLSGLHLLQKGHSIVIDQVDKLGAGAKAGFISGDVLVELAGLNATNVGLFKLRSLLCREGKITCHVLRGAQKLKVILEM